MRITVILFLFFASISFARAEEFSPCPDGSGKPATQAQVDASGGAIKLGTPVCTGDVALGISNEAGEAKQYLNSLPKRPLSKCAPPDKEHIDKLDNAFAVCAARFFKAYTAKHGPVYITSAFRSAGRGTAGDGSGRSEQNCASSAATSNHSRGLALDVNPANESLYPVMWKFASDNPHLGVCFPRPPYNGSTDRPHMILAGIGGREGARCAQYGTTKPCSGAPSPSSPDSSSADNTNNQLPSTGIANQIRQMFAPPAQPQGGMQPQQQQLPPPPPPGNIQPVSYNAPVGNPMQPPSNSDSSQTVENSGSGSGSADESLSDFSTDEEAYEHSIGDKLLEIAESGEREEEEKKSGSSSPELVVSGNDRATVNTSPGAVVAPTQEVAPFAIAPSLLYPIQTFLTSDLGQPLGQVGGSESLLATTLFNIQVALRELLRVLTPFGLRKSTEGGE